MVHERGEGLVLDLHMARNNPQWREFFDDEVLVVFSGPARLRLAALVRGTRSGAYLELRRGTCLRGRQGHSDRQENMRRTPTPSA